MSDLRNLAGALILAGTPLAAQAQTSPRANLAAEDQVVLNADRVAEDAENNLIIADGNVEARYQERVLRADRLVYDQITGKIRASGDVIIIDEDGTQQFADEVEVSSDLADGFAIGFSTRLSDNGGVAAANSAVRQSDGISALDQAVFTACKTCEESGKNPTWSLRARRAVLDDNSQTISYRDAILEIAGIPVLYLPFLVHPDPTSDRRSGLLIPNINISERTGFSYTQPYYQVISPSADITITPTFFTEIRPLLGVQARKRFHRGSIIVDGSFTFDQDFDNDGVGFGPEFARGHIFSTGLFQINNNWQIGFGVERTSDDTFLRQFEIQGLQRARGLFDGENLTLLSQLFATGQDENFYFEAAVLGFQDLRVDSPDIPNAPIASPVFFGERLFDFGAGGSLGINVSGAILTRSVEEMDPIELNPDSRRLSIGADWTTTRILPGGLVVEPFVEVRGDYFDLDPDANEAGDGSVVRAVGSVGTKLSWPVARPGRFADLIIEPQVLGAWGLSNVNDPSIPIEDSLLFEFDEASLFEANGFGNFDLYEGDGRLSAGISGTVRFHGGPTITAIAGRRWRSQADPAFDAFSNLDGTSSDWVGSVSANFGRALSLETRLRLDEDTFALNRIDARVRSAIWRFNLSARYFRIDEDISLFDEPDEGIDFSSSARITNQISVFYQQRRDITADVDNRLAIGAAYEDDCSRFEISYVRSETMDRTIGPNDSIQFRFSLKTLGDFGSNELR